MEFGWFYQEGRNRSLKDSQTKPHQKLRQYRLSPNEQNVLGGLVKDLPSTIQKKISDNFFEITAFCLVPGFGTYYYAKSTVEKEKIAHRY